MVNILSKSLCESCFEEVDTETCPHCGYSRSTYEQDRFVLPVGSVLEGRYMIGRVLGKGGFGITYLAYDMKLGCRVAVKEYYPLGMAIRNLESMTVTAHSSETEESFKTGAEKFYQEARLVAELSGNPNIVNVSDVFYENETVYFTMGYLEGMTLKNYLKKYGKISEEQAVYFARDVSKALISAHKKNVLHRDISPDNIMVCTDGTVKLLDFGAARQVAAEGSASLSVILKQGYAPLEQYRKKGNQGPWTDIYSLGATIYYSLTLDLLEDPISRQDDDAEFLSNKHNISPALWEIIKKATMLKASDRYQDIYELLDALDDSGIASKPIIEADDRPGRSFSRRKADKAEAAPVPAMEKTVALGEENTIPLMAAHAKGESVSLTKEETVPLMAATVALNDDPAPAMEKTVALEDDPVPPMRAAAMDKTLALNDDMNATVALSPASGPAQAAVKKRSSKGIIAGVAALAVILVIGAVAAVNFSSKDTENTNISYADGSDSYFGEAADASFTGEFNYKAGIFNYKILGDGIEITRYKGDDSTVEIPSEYDGKPIVAVGDDAFLRREGIKSVIIPDSVQRIGNNVFNNCTDLESITIPDGVAEIGEYVFANCPSLKTVTLPESVTSIGKGAFNSCTGLESITIPGSVTVIGDGAFRECTSLESIAIPESVTEIGDRIFMDCISLKTAVISGGVSEISGSAFQGCESLASVFISDGAAKINTYAFAGCTSLKSINIPGSVTMIDSFAFENCTSLKTVYVPPFCKLDKNVAFQGCDDVEIEVRKDSPSAEAPEGPSEPEQSSQPAETQPAETQPTETQPQKQEPPADNTDYSKLFTYEASGNGIKITGYISSDRDVNIPAQIGGKPVVAIGEEAFKKSKITSIVIPDSVTEIGKNAFAYCPNLTSIVIPDSVTEIGIGAFKECYLLKSVSLPSNITTIPISAFYRCLNLTSITIPDSVTIIDSSAFEKCDKLTSVTLPNGLTDIGYAAFGECKRLKSIDIPSSVVRISRAAFSDCSALTSIVIPDKVSNIDLHTFLNCTNLETASLPADCNVHEAAFSHCDKVKITYRD